MRLKKWISHCIFKMLFGRGRVPFLATKNSEKAKLPKICKSFCGSMPIAQLKRCHLSPRPNEENLLNFIILCYCTPLYCSSFKKVYDFTSLQCITFYSILLSFINWWSISTCSKHLISFFWHSLIFDITYIPSIML